MIELDELRERALELMQTSPAEVTPEAAWLVAELEKHKEVLVGVIDYLIASQTTAPPSPLEE